MANSKPLPMAYYKLLEEYRQYMEATGYSQSSVRTKSHGINRFLAWLNTSHIENITAVQTIHLQAYVTHAASWTMQATTRHSHLRSLIQFFTWLQSNVAIQHNPAASLILRRPSRQQLSAPRALSRPQVAELFSSANTCLQKALLSLAYGCGLRLAEIAALDITDINLAERKLIVQKGKGSKRRVIPMHYKVVEALEQYIRNARPYSKDKALFINEYNNNHRMGDATIRNKIKSLMRSCGIEEGYSVHSLRHSIATHLLQQGLSIEQIRLFLGHATLESTQVYTHVVQAQINQL